jgi:hypothetical protein
MTKAADADEHKIKVLNVAGPRLSGWKEGYAFARAVMAAIISKAGTYTRRHAATAKKIGCDNGQIHVPLGIPCSGLGAGLV